MNCWDFWDCPKETKDTCKVFLQDAGNECWFFQEDIHGECPAVASSKVKACSECPFYQKMRMLPRK